MAHILGDGLQFPIAEHRGPGGKAAVLFSLHRNHIGLVLHFPVQKVYNLRRTVYHTMHAQLLSDLFINLLRGQLHRRLHGRIVDVIIQQRRRNNLLVRVFLRLQLHGGIHIHHKLQLQAIVQSGQVKLFIAGFIVDYLHIHLFPVFGHVHPVDTPLQAHLLPL